MLWDKSFRTWAFVKQADGPLQLSAETGNALYWPIREIWNLKKINLLRVQQLPVTDCVQRGCLGFFLDLFLSI